MIIPSKPVCHMSLYVFHDLAHDFTCVLPDHIRWDGETQDRVSLDQAPFQPFGRCAHAHVSPVQVFLNGPEDLVDSIAVLDWVLTR
jgi:hypothetical protein